VINGHANIVKDLVENGANINVKDKDGKTPLDYAKGAKDKGVVKYLQEKATEQLFEAVEAGEIEKVKELIANGANINKRDSWMQTPLHYAAEFGNSEIAKILIDNGAKVNVKSKMANTTPLKIAERKENEEMTKILKEAKKEQSILGKVFNKINWDKLKATTLIRGMKGLFKKADKSKNVEVQNEVEKVDKSKDIKLETESMAVNKEVSTGGNESREVVETEALPTQEQSQEAQAQTETIPEVSVSEGQGPAQPTGNVEENNQVEELNQRTENNKEEEPIRRDSGFSELGPVNAPKANTNDITNNVESKGKTADNMESRDIAEGKASEKDKKVKEKSGINKIRSWFKSSKTSNEKSKANLYKNKNLPNEVTSDPNNVKESRVIENRVLKNVEDVIGRLDIDANSNKVKKESIKSQTEQINNIIDGLGEKANGADINIIIEEKDKLIVQITKDNKTTEFDVKVENNKIKLEEKSKATAIDFKDYTKLRSEKLIDGKIQDRTRISTIKDVEKNTDRIGKDSTKKASRRSEINNKNVSKSKKKTNQNRKRKQKRKKLIE